MRRFVLLLIIGVFLIPSIYAISWSGGTTNVINQTIIGNLTIIGLNASQFQGAFDTNMSGAINTTQMNYNNNILTILGSWLKSLFYTKEEVNIRDNSQLNLTQFSGAFDNNFSAKDTDDLIEGSTNLYDNQSWNEARSNIIHSPINFATNSSYMTSSDVEGSFNSTSWNRSGTNVFLANLGDRVGIGTASPDSELHVNGVIHITDPSSIRYFIEVFSAGGVGYIDSYDSTGNDYQDLVVRANDFIFEGQGTERFRIEDTGNVGIGTTTPTHTLTVVGDTNVTGDIYSNNYQVLSYQRIVNVKTVTMTVVI